MSNRNRWSRSKNLEADTLQLNEIPSKPGAAKRGVKIYVRPNHKLYLEDSDGVEYEIKLKKVKKKK